MVRHRIGNRNMEDDMINKPIRVQLSRKKGWRMPYNTTKVDRTTQWGNPFVINRAWYPPLLSVPHQIKWGGVLCAMPDRTVYVNNAADAVKAFRDFLASNPQAAESVKSKLRGLNLACWCFESPCHADILLEIANS